MPGIYKSYNGVNPELCILKIERDCWKFELMQELYRFREKQLLKRNRLRGIECRYSSIQFQSVVDNLDSTTNFPAAAPLPVIVLQRLRVHDHHLSSFSTRSNIYLYGLPPQKQTTLYPLTPHAIASDWFPTVHVTLKTT